MDYPLSASKLKAFDRCEKAFELSYIQGVPEAGGENHYLRRGNAVHEAIEGALRDLYEGEPNFDESFIKHRMSEEYRANSGANGYELDDENHEFVLDCLGVAARFVAKMRPEELLGIEDRVHFSSAGLEHDFLGYIDVATPSEVWDWKTGKSDGKDLQETLQGAVYMAGYANLYGHAPDAIRFAYLKEGKTRTLTPDDDMWATTVSKAKDLFDTAQKGTFTATPEDSKCYWCDYEYACPASKVGGGGIDWEAYP